MKTINISIKILFTAYLAAEQTYSIVFLTSFVVSWH